jgi:hypothetical protein
MEVGVTEVFMKDFSLFIIPLVHETEIKFRGAGGPSLIFHLNYLQQHWSHGLRS